MGKTLPVPAAAGTGHQVGGVRDRAPEPVQGSAGNVFALPVAGLCLMKQGSPVPVFNAPAAVHP